MPDFVELVGDGYIAGLRDFNARHERLPTEQAVTRDLERSPDRRQPAAAIARGPAWPAGKAEAAAC